ncbi:SIS domain-containing protein [Peribacillus sp. SCS-26]|uniref:SIS domain-containing protein n=1 Tax=Paraperibacillus marinus TaxID=3115295 RepID=UPI003905D834
MLAFSRSGQTKDLLQSVKKAKEKGAKLVSFTAYGETPLTKLSNAVLSTLHPSLKPLMR